MHGDPKISNVMFSGETAVGMIDLDTCNRHTLLVDLGDAIRSWCRDGYEDEVRSFIWIDSRGYCVAMRRVVARFQRMRWTTLDGWSNDHLGTGGRFARDVMEGNYFAFNTALYESEGLIILAHEQHDISGKRYAEEAKRGADADQSVFSRQMRSRTFDVQ